MKPNETGQSIFYAALPPLTDTLDPPVKVIIRPMMTGRIDEKVLLHMIQSEPSLLQRRMGAREAAHQTARQNDLGMNSLSFFFFWHRRNHTTCNFNAFSLCFRVFPQTKCDATEEMYI